MIAILGFAQIARRLLGLDNPVLSRLLRSCHGADEARTPHRARESVKTTVRRFVRGSPFCDTLMDLWSEVIAGKRSSVVQKCM